RRLSLSGAHGFGSTPIKTLIFLRGEHGSGVRAFSRICTRPHSLSLSLSLSLSHTQAARAQTTSLQVLGFHGVAAPPCLPIAADLEHLDRPPQRRATRMCR
ncbi:hypothetical protein GOP47_0018162, partial [Adiantum capillus-veneris]